MPNNFMTGSLTHEGSKAPSHTRSDTYALDNGYGYNIWSKTLACVIAAAIGGGLNHSPSGQLKQLVILAAIGGILYGASLQPILSSILDELGWHKSLTFQGFNHSHFLKNTSRRIGENVLAAIIGLMIADWLWKKLGHQTQNSVSESRDMMLGGVALYETVSTLYNTLYLSCQQPPADRQTTLMTGANAGRYVRPHDVVLELVERGHVNTETRGI
jgi:hypothetical protein